jgi:hypothetical protein
MNPDPFTALGLPADPDLTDEQVRAAWRSIAAATHPDRPDGGDVTRYTAAATAYAQLRTAWGRSEAYADLTADEPYVPAPAPRCRSRPVLGSSVRCGWSRPASAMGGRCGCCCAPSLPPCSRCWSCDWCRDSHRARLW